ncbi:hypothetical protein IMZ38_03285 [Thermosphaera chiliense]|uniref:Uncharacterized protein n=1 Tax=Thermosphaera chiliense TaxID=3402707 RepID=A0A7M1UU93_9CREN|nr:hypothetical protein [Thermosphaera aggregans]QOR94942.1 hypothetical protein IMZ38_03285 [Thermosphaera aggregans]
MKHTRSRDPFLTISSKIGVEEASILRLGEPVEGEVAWKIRDLLVRKHDYQVLYENEEVEEDECYSFAILIESRYLFYLIKTNDKSVAYLKEYVEKEWERIENILEDNVTRCGLEKQGV